MGFGGSGRRAVVRVTAGVVWAGWAGCIWAGGGGAGQELLLFLASGTDVSRFAAEHRLTHVSTLRSDPDAHVFAPATRADLVGPVPTASFYLPALRANPGVRWAFENRRTNFQPMSFVPNDPLFFASDATFSGYRGQWYLANSVVPGRDVNILGAWARGFTGQGVVVGVVDDSVDIRHPDLSPNVSLADSFDFGQTDADPSGVFTTDRHGTAVAGIVAARGGNGIGMSGGAPLASLAGLRVDFPNQTVAMFVDATLYRSSGSNPTISVKNHSYGVIDPWEPTPEDVVATAISSAAGTIHVFSAGNSRGGSGEDSNKKDIQKSPDAITVAALGASGVFATYSNFGACVFVTAPSSSNRTGEVRVPTTDREGNLGYNQSQADSDPMPDLDYTSSFGGTSASSPVVAGVMTLLKEANPAANTRFAKHVLARTSRVVDPNDNTVSSDGGWRTNAAGFTFNQNYGFGLVDAGAVVEMAPRYLGVTPLVTLAPGPVDVMAVIPDGPTSGVSRSITVAAADAAPLEEVLLTLDISHPSRGQLDAFVTSPSGYTSRAFARFTGDTGSDIRWQFTLNAFWGEWVSGEWTVQVRDRTVGTVGTWNSFELQFRTGTLVSLPIPEPGGVAGVLMVAGVMLGRRRRG